MRVSSEAFKYVSSIKLLLSAVSFIFIFIIILVLFSLFLMKRNVLVYAKLHFLFKNTSELRRHTNPYLSNKLASS